MVKSVDRDAAQSFWQASVSVGTEINHSIDVDQEKKRLLMLKEGVASTAGRRERFWRPGTAKLDKARWPAVWHAGGKERGGAGGRAIRCASGPVDGPGGRQAGQRRARARPSASARAADLPADVG
ncbi:hypothetical protein GCM10027514_28020 [Azotobacter armeniacus]